MRSKAEMLAELRGRLQEMFEAREAGALSPRMAREQGYVDGLMRAMLDLGVVSKHELLALVAAERARVSGPATRELDTVAA